jgi:polyhydroxybutyrate depolymerase
MRASSRWFVRLGWCLAALTPLAAQRRTADLERLRYDGRDRTYIVRAPAGIRTGERFPVVIALHGGGGNAANAEQMTGFTALVERERLIAVYPNGSGRLPNSLLTWNASHCCGFAMERTIDDVVFINALLDTLAARYPVDPRRIYVTGMSNGAMMSHRLGRELSTRIAAIAPVVGAVFGDEPASRGSVSALIINGLLDTSVPPNGGLSSGIGCDAWDGSPAAPNIAQAAYWATANGCDADPVREQRGAIVTTRYRCPEGTAVELVQLTDNGHAWPAGQRGSRRADAPAASYNATEAMWAFFKAHPKR